MTAVTNDNFGLAIAYLLPGFVLLWGFNGVSTTVDGWLGGGTNASATVGGFLYVTLASLACGVIASTIRWAVVDTIHHLTGLREPHWEFANLQDRFAAFEGLVRNHYRFYQFHANMLVAVVIAFGLRKATAGWGSGHGAIDAAVAVLVVVLFLGSRDTLRKYYARSAALLATARRR